MSSPRPQLLLVPVAVLLADMAALAQVTGEERWPEARLMFVVSLAFSQAPLVAVWASLERELTAAARWVLSSSVVFLWSWQLRQKAPQLTPELADWLLVLGSATLAAAGFARWLTARSPGDLPEQRRWQFSLGALLGLLTLAAVGAALLRGVAIPQHSWARALVLVAAAGALAGFAWRMALPSRRLLRAAVPLTATALVAGQAMVWAESAAASQWRLAMGLVAAQSAAIVVAGKTLSSSMVRTGDPTGRIRCADQDQEPTESTAPPPEGLPPSAP